METRADRRFEPAMKTYKAKQKWKGEVDKTELKKSLVRQAKRLILP